MLLLVLLLLMVASSGDLVVVTMTNGLMGGDGGCSSSTTSRGSVVDSFDCDCGALVFVADDAGVGAEDNAAKLNLGGSF